MAVRWQVWLDMPQGAERLHHYYKYVYYSSWCRFDELLAGVALALLRNRHGAAWARITAHGNALLAAGVLVTGGAFRLFLGDHYGMAATVFGYPLLALGVSLLVLAALAPDSILHRVRVPGASRLALWSYAIYLVHKQVCVMLAGPLAAAGYGPEDWRAIGVSLTASVAAGWLLYRLVETPFMVLRERFVPDNAAPPQGALSAPR
jgi:peptidoglycan/LPS O-acetylase OafA/YrhL